MAADNLSPVNLPPVAPTSDAPPHDSRAGNDKRKDRDKNKNKDKQKESPRDQEHRTPSPRNNEKQLPSSDIDFERAEHELDRFA
jgi:hypothetical protein